MALIKVLFKKHELLITPEIYEELLVPLDYNYEFPKKIFKEFKIIDPTERESREYRRLLLENRSVDKGELEAIVICKNRQFFFASVDKVALDFAKEKSVQTISLYSILKSLWVSKILSKKGVDGLIQDIEHKENTKIKNKDVIFE